MITNQKVLKEIRKYTKGMYITQTEFTSFMSTFFFYVRFAEIKIVVLPKQILMIAEVNGEKKNYGEISFKEFKRILEDIKKAQYTLS